MLGTGYWIASLCRILLTLYAVTMAIVKLKPDFLQSLAVSQTIQDMLIGNCVYNVKLRHS